MILHEKRLPADSSHERACLFPYILNKSENATLQYFTFCEKVMDKTYLLGLIMISRHPANDSSKLHQFVSFGVRAMFLFVFSSLFTEFCSRACAKKDSSAYLN